MNLEVVSIAEERGLIVSPELLAAAEPVHCQLRPRLQGQYLPTMMRVFQEGAEMCAATEQGRILGIAVFRVYENTFHGKHLYVDDLVTDEAQRSRGIGKALMDHLAVIARGRDCRAVVLDSGTQRTQAHAFYFREGLVIQSFHFTKSL
jgi:ribosomal protein S18 acetylase RimI-like enzyme